MACNSYRNLHGKVISLVLYLIKKPRAAALASPLMLILKKENHIKNGLVESHQHCVKCHFKTYATKDIIAKPKPDIINFTKWINVLPSDYAKALWMRILRVLLVYVEHFLKSTFVADLSNSVCQIIYSS